MYLSPSVPVQVRNAEVLQWNKSDKNKVFKSGHCHLTIEKCKARSSGSQSTGKRGQSVAYPDLLLCDPIWPWPQQLHLPNPGPTTKLRAWHRPTLDSISTHSIDLPPPWSPLWPGYEVIVLGGVLPSAFAHLALRTAPWHYIIRNTQASRRRAEGTRKQGHGHRGDRPCTLIHRN